MQKKIVQSIIVFVLVFIATLAISSYYLRSLNQIQDEKEFLDFLAQKKKLPQKNREVFLIASKIAYSWSDNNFEKKSTTTAYEKNIINKTVSKKEIADLNNNSFQETYSLGNGRLMIIESSKTVWQSPSNWWVDNFDLADSNNDGVLEINLSLWKAGNFGSSKPFWIKENDMSVKNHFFVFNFINDSMKLTWGSSNLSAPNCEFKFTDVDEDKKNELIVIEGDYSQTLICKGDYLAVWKWNGWGFSNEWRGEKGNFSNLKIEKNDGKNYIVVDSL
jgi:hypothetical protein